MANLFHIERTDNKITLGTTGTTINIASHTASSLLALDASKDLEVVTIGTSLDYTRPTLNTIQDIRTTAAPTFAGGTFTGVVTGVNPTTAAHLATKDYVDSAIGAHFDYFISNTASGVGTNYVAYTNETGEAESTLQTAALGAGDDQLLFSWLTETGEPGVEALREGVYVGHIHLHRGTGDKTCEAYWTVSKVDADGSSNETLVVTSETSDPISDSETRFVLRGALADKVTIGKTQRLLFKVYGNIGASGGDCEVTTTQEGATDCHFRVTLPSYVWQLQGDVLDDLNILGASTADGEFLVATGIGELAWESGATVRTSIGLGNVENTALSTWVGSGNITTLGTIATGTWEATDVGIAHGGTGQSTAQAAIDALTAVSGATNEHVLTKDTATGNAIWKAAAGGSDSEKVKIDAVATADYLGAASNDGVLRTGAGLSYTDGGDFITIACDGVLEDLDTLGAPASDGQFIVATGAGVFAYESTTTARTSLGVGEGDSPTLANLSLGTGEITCGSINRAADTLTLEIGGIAELSITTAATTFGGNIVIPDGSTIGSASDTDVMTIDASGNTTFSVFPITPSAAPDADYEVSNKKYIDDSIAFSAYTTEDSNLDAMTTAHAYLAQTDGFVVAYANIANADSLIYGYVGDTNDPAGAGDLIAVMRASTSNDHCCITFPVQSGKYFEIVWGTLGGSAAIRWMSVGALQKPVDQD